MKATRRVNTLVRRNLRRIRLQSGLALGEAARRAGIPLSSYSCLESGHYAISLENLGRILEALEIDIGKVWPLANIEMKNLEPEKYSLQIQVFRLREIISLSRADGAALLSVRGDRCRVLLQEALDELEVEKLVSSISGDRPRPSGFWFSSTSQNRRYLLYVKGNSCPDFVRQLIRHYLIIWMRVFM